MLMSFALVFKYLGINSDGEVLGALDYVYSSMVTFSTLGDGDLSPLPNTILWAAMEAILGNLHLGFIVVSVLAALNRD